VAQCGSVAPLLDDRRFVANRAGRPSIRSFEFWLYARPATPWTLHRIGSRQGTLKLRLARSKSVRRYLLFHRVQITGGGPFYDALGFYRGRSRLDS